MVAQAAVPLSARDCWLLIGTGCSAFLAQLLLNRGLQLKTAAEGSAIACSEVVWCVSTQQAHMSFFFLSMTSGCIVCRANLLSMMLFQEQPGVISLGGAACIASGVWVVAADKHAKQQSHGQPSGLQADEGACSENGPDAGSSEGYEAAAGYRPLPSGPQRQ
jgi:drug/metabolite transporter (DMT)-like permease